MYNTKLQGRSRIRRTHNYTRHRRQKQLNPIVTVGNKITKAVRSDKAEFRTGKTRSQPVPMSDIRGLRHFYNNLIKKSIDKIILPLTLHN